MKVFGNKKILKDGDIVTIDGKRYYCDRDLHCYECALNGEETCLNRNNRGYDCTYWHVSLITASEAIKREESNIKERQRLISEFTKEKEREIKESQTLISKLSK